MEKYVVIYKSKYGATERYAKWIAEDLCCNAFTLDQISQKDLSQYENIVYGGGVHAGGIMGFDKFKKWLRPILTSGKPCQKVVVFSVGINNNTQECRMQLRDINFDKDYLKRLICFYFPGAYDPAKVKGIDKAIMTMVKKMVAGKSEKERTESDNLLLENVEKGCDFVSRNHIISLVNEIKQAE